MAKTAPFEELKDGLPLWRLQVEDPAAAAEAKLEVAWKALNLARGGVFAISLKLHDIPNRPHTFHYALPWGSLALTNFRRAGALRLVFERNGWMNDAQKTVELDLGPVEELPEGSLALADYVRGYQEALPRLGKAEAVWEEMAGSGAGTAKKSSILSKLCIAIALLCLAMAAYQFLKK